MRALAVLLLLALPAGAQETEAVDIGIGSTLWGDQYLSICPEGEDCSISYVTLDAPEPTILRLWLKDGELWVEREGGEYCGGSVSCGVYGHTREDHCELYREVYGAKDGEVVLLRTVHPKITPAQERRVEWPEGGQP